VYIPIFGIHLALSLTVPSWWPPGDFRFEAGRQPTGGPELPVVGNSGVSDWPTNKLVTLVFPPCRFFWHSHRSPRY